MWLTTITHESHSQKVSTFCAFACAGSINRSLQLGWKIMKGVTSAFSQLGPGRETAPCILKGVRAKGTKGDRPARKPRPPRPIKSDYRLDMVLLLENAKIRPAISAPNFCHQELQHTLCVLHLRCPYITPLLYCCLRARSLAEVRGVNEPSFTFPERRMCP